MRKQAEPASAFSDLILLSPIGTEATPPDLVVIG